MSRIENNKKLDLLDNASRIALNIIIFLTAATLVFIVLETAFDFKPKIEEMRVHDRQMLEEIQKVQDSLMKLRKT